MTTDPVCGMRVDERIPEVRAVYQRAEYEGKTYYFCSERCRAAFEKQPERYAVQSSKTDNKDALV